MPNHVTTVCTVTGPAEALARFVENHLVIEEDSAERCLSFDTIIPRPASIRATSSGSDASIGLLALRGLTQPSRYAWSPRTTEEAVAQYARRTDGAKTQAELLAWLKEHRPSALAEGQKAAEALDETGHADWYEWALANWGTKWGGYSFEIEEESPERLVFRFDTAWSFPLPIFRKLENLYPDLTFAVISFDEGWFFGCRGEFGGRRDFAQVDATDDLYEQVYGRKPDRDEDDSEQVSP